MKLRTIAAVAGASTLASSELLAQCSGWLPNVALPTEFAGSGIRTFPSAIIGFDFDGPGPEPESLVVAGVLGSTVPDGNVLQRFDGRRWIGMGPWITTELFVFDDDDTGPNLPRLHRASGAYIARLNGENWEVLSPIPFFVAQGDPDVRAAVTYDVDGDGPLAPVLVVGGRFGGAGSTLSANVIAWEGTGWAPLGSGLPGENGGLVQDLCVFDPDGPGPLTPLLIAGGSIIDANCKVAAWDGASWTCLASAAGIVNALDLFDPDGAGPRLPVLVAAGGRFTTINGTPANNIASYDGQTWRPIGAGLPVLTESMVVLDPDGDGPLQQLIFASQFSAPMRVFNGQTWSDSTGSPRSASQMTTLRNARFSDTPQLVVGATSSSSPSMLARYALSNSAPQIITQPPTQVIIRSNAPTALSVVATGDELTFRWFRNSRPFDEGVVTAGVRSGAFGPSLTFDVPAIMHSGTYYVEVGNACGLVRSRSVNVSIICVSDFDANNTVDFFDYLDFIAAFAAQDPSSDIDNDGQIDFADYLSFLQAFSNGC